MTKTMTAILAASWLACAAIAADKACAQTDDPLAKLAWLTGAWEGKGMGGEVHDWYLPEHDGEILNVFTVSRDGKIVRYEFRRIYAGTDGKVMLQEKAWRTGLDDVAPVAQKPLVSADADHIQISNFKYDKTGTDSMTFTMTLPGPDGKPRDNVVPLSRQIGFVAP